MGRQRRDHHRPDHHSHIGQAKKRQKTSKGAADAGPDPDLDAGELRGHAKFWERRSKLGFLESLSGADLEGERPRKAKAAANDALPQRLPVKDQSGRLRPSRMSEADAERIASGKDQVTPDAEPIGDSECEEVAAACPYALMSEPEARNRIAELSSAATAAPETELKTSLDQLAKIANSSNHTSVRQLALLSQVALFVDLCPSYPIRHPQEENVQLTKQVKATRKYEANLLSGYYRLLEQLIGLTKRLRRRPETTLSSRNHWAMGFVATRGLCQLLSHLSHFNHCKLIITTLVSLANHPFSNEVRELVLRTLSELVQKPANSDHAVEVATLVCKIVVDQRHEIQPSLIRLLSAFPLQNRPVPAKKSKTNVQIDVDLKRDLQAGEAVQSAAKVNRTHRVLLEKVFRIYFTILRSSPSSVLLPAVLGGLAKFAHLVNVELLLDLLSCLDQLMSHPDLPLRSTLNCIVAAFRMLQAQGSAVVIDARGFYFRLYNEMDSLSRGEHHHLIGTMLDAVDLMFIKRRQIAVERVAAFVLKLADLALHLPGNSSKACLHTMYQILARYPTCTRLLDNDDCGSGALISGQGDVDPDQVKPFSTCLWQLSLLEQSYDPMLSKYSRVIAHQQTLPVDQLRLTPAQLLRPDPIAFPGK